MQKSLLTALLSAMLLSHMASAQTDTNTPTQWEKNKSYHLTILHTNDHHGRFWPNSNGEYGMAARKTLVDRIRKEVAAKGGSVLLFSGGDINTGVPESDVQNAEPDFKGMKRIGYDAMAVGNHEFDNALPVLMKQRDWAGFPLLSANIYDKTTGKRLFAPYHIFNEQGIKIAVIGLTTEDTAKIGNPEYIKNLEFRDPKIEAAKVIESLKQHEKPDLIFAITHMGHYDNGKHSVNAPGDVSLARSLPEGALQMIVGGHSQDPVCMANEKKTAKIADYIPGTPCAPDKQNGTWIVQAHEWGKYVGRADYTFKDGVLTLEHYQLIPVNLKQKIKKADGSSELVFYEDEIPADPEMVAFLQPYQDIGQKELAQPVGEITGKFEGDRKAVRFHPTNLGRFIAAGYAAKTNADFAVISGGSIRDSLQPGTVTYKDILIVQPFGNTVVYSDMTGQQVQDYLNVVGIKPEDTGAYPQFWNVSMDVKPDHVENIKIKGEPLDLQKTYRLATVSFNANGGDGYPVISNTKGYVDTGFVDADVTKEFLKAQSPLDTHKYDPE